MAQAQYLAASQATRQYRLDHGPVAVSAQRCLPKRNSRTRSDHADGPDLGILHMNMRHDNPTGLSASLLQQEYWVVKR